MFWKKKVPQEAQNIQISDPMLIAFRQENAHSTLAVHLDPDQLGTPAEAGLMLADVGRHMARALAQNGAHGTEEEAFARLLQVFLAEARTPTSPPAQ